MTKNHKTIANALGFSAILLWALNALLTVKLKRIPSFEIISIVFTISFVTSMIYVGSRGIWHKLKQPPSVWITGILGLFLTNFGYITSFKLAPAAQVDLIFYLWPIMAVLISPLILKEPLSKQTLIGSSFGLLAVLLIVTGDEGHGNIFDINDAHLKGYAMAFFGATSWALYNVTSRRIKKAPVEVIGIFFGGGALLSCIAHMTTEDFVMPTLSESLNLGLMGLTTQGAAYFCWDYAVKRGNFKLLKTSAYAVPILSIGLLVVFGISTATIELAISTGLILFASVLSGTNLIPFLGESLAILREHLSIREHNHFSLHPLEDRAENFTRRLGSLIKQDSKSVRTLTFLLIAGPIIYVFIQALLNFYLGRSSFLHLSSLSLITALCISITIGFIVRYLYGSYRGKSIMVIQDQYYEIVQKLFEFIVEIRNISFQNLSPKEQNVYAASIIIENPESTPLQIYQAVLDISSSQKVASIASAAEIYRKYGLTHKIWQILQEEEENIRQTVHELKSISEKVGELLWERLNGRTPSLNQGVERPDGFIERTLKATETKNFNYMTLDDAFEIFKLTLELLSDRTIKYLSPRFNFKKEFFKKGMKIDTLRYQKRAATLKRNNRLHAILDLLPDQNVLHRSELPITKVIEFIRDGVTELSESVRQKAQLLKQHPHPNNLIQLQEDLKTIIEIKNLYRASVRQHALSKKLLRDMQQIKVDTNEVNKIDWELSKREYHRKTIQIKEEEITLGVSEKDAVISSIYETLKNIFIKKHGRKIYVFSSKEPIEFDEEFLKKIATELFGALSDHIPLTLPKIQRAIELSNGLNLSALNVQWGTRKKVGWLSTQSRRMKQNVRTLAFSLAKSLIQTYHLNLNDQMVEFLSNEYGVSGDFLSSIPPLAETETLNTSDGTEIDTSLLEEIETIIENILDSLENVN